MTHYEKALRYVADQITYEEAIKACPQDERAPLNADFVTNVCDIMEEYGMSNDLPEGWWLSEHSEEETAQDVISLVIDDSKEHREQAIGQTLLDRLFHWQYRSRDPELWEKIFGYVGKHLYGKYKAMDYDMLQLWPSLDGDNRTKFVHYLLKVWDKFGR